MKSPKFIFRLVFLAVLLPSLSIVNAQVDVHNYGTLITIQKGAIFSIDGDYVDNSNTDDFGEDPNEPDDPNEPALVLDAPIFLSGTLRITGNIYNNSGIGTKLIYGFENVDHTGKVILEGSSLQYITGSKPSYFPNLEINNPDGVELGQNIQIDNDLTLISGSVELKSKDIELGIHGEIVGEDASNKLFGYPGQVTTTDAQYTINENITDLDYRGIGIGYTTDGNTNYSKVRWYREHGPDVSQYEVADGVHVLRAYKMSTSTLPAPFETVSMPILYFKYHESELNGLAEGDLALYVSNDDGLTWLKATSTVDEANNIVTATDVPILGSDVNPPAAHNIFTLAIADCLTPANIPSGVITSTNSEVINGGAMDICDGNQISITVSPNDIGYYQWDTPAGDVDTQNFTADLSLAHDGNFSVEVRNQRGCENNNSLAVNVRDIPVASFSIDPDPQINPICLGTELSLVDESTVTEGPITVWDWNYDDGNNGPNSANPKHIYAEYGEYNPQLTVESIYGCTSSPKLWHLVDPQTLEQLGIAPALLTIESLPVPAFEMRDAVYPSGNVISERCEDLPVYFRNQSTYSDYLEEDKTPGLTYTWDFGPAISNEIEPSYSYEDHGNYIVSLTAIAPTTCAVTVSQPIIIDPEPIPEFTPRINGNAITEACTGEYILFDNTSSMPDATAMSYSWDFGDGTVSTDLSPEKQFIVEGDYTVWLTVMSDVHGCSENTSFDILVNPPPTGGFTISDQNICIDEGVVFTNNSAITSGTLSYFWDFGDGTTSNSPAGIVDKTYAIAGLYTVWLTRTSNKGCENVVSGNLTVHPEPSPNFIFSNSCDGDAVTFFNASSIQSDNIISYLWDFGEGNTSSDESPMHLFDTYGDYNVTLTATSDFGCIGEIAQVISIYQNPSFNLGSSIVTCAESYLLDPSTDVDGYIPLGSTFTWSDSDENLIGDNAILMVNAPDTYIATITSAAPESCETTVNIPLFLFQPVDLGADLEVCEQTVLDAEWNTPASQKALAESTTYQWRKGGIPISTDQTIVVTENAEYTVEVTRTVGAQSCSSIDAVIVDITPTPPVPNLNPTYETCDGQSVMLDAGIAADSYSWIYLNSGLEVANTSTYPASIGGNYRLIVTNGSCAAMDETTVLIEPSPIVSFTSSAANICLGAPILFEDLSYINNGTISSIAWDFGDGTEAIDQPTPQKNYVASGDYFVKLTATSNNGCTNSFTQMVTIKDLPVADFTISDACAGTAVNIVNNSGANGATFFWDFGDGTTSTAAFPNKSYNLDGLYDVTLTVQVDGCSTSFVQAVTVNPLPALDFGGTIITCGANIMLDAFNPGAAYRWYDPNTEMTLSNNQQYLVTENMEIGLEVTSANGCIAIDEADVVLIAPIVVDLGEDRSVCDNEVLDAGYFPGGTYLWSTGESSRTIEATISGIYSVTVNDQNACLGMASVTLTVNTTPIIDLGSDISACQGELTVLDPGFDASYSYLWSTGEMTPTINVTTSGDYSLFVSKDNCSIMDEITVTINPKPEVDFVDTDICDGETLSFSNLTSYAGLGTVSYLWTFGDDTFSANEHPDKLYDNPGAYLVTLIATSPEGCSDQVSKVINVMDAPNANFTSSIGCIDDNLTFSNTSTYIGGEALTYSWDFDDGQQSFDIEPTHIFSNSGSYFVSLTVYTPLGCISSISKELVVGDKPILNNWENSISTCSNPIILDAQNVGSTYLWSDNSTDQTLEVTQSGDYLVEITSPNDCAITGEVTVLIYDEVVLTLEDQDEGCGEVILDPGHELPNSTYLWSTGLQTSTLSATETGIYSVEVISSDLCVGTDTTSVIVRPVPEIDLGVDESLCVGDIKELDGSSDLEVTYLWSTGENTKHIQANQSGTYSVLVTTPFGCINEDEILLTFHELPTISLEENVTACDEVQLDADNPGDTFIWSTGSTDQSINVTTSGTYSVEVTNVYGCAAEDVSEVTILSSPDLNLGEDITLCAEETTNLDAGSSNLTYLWSDNSTERLLNVGASATYSVTVTDNVGCSSYDEVVVVVRDPLGLDLGDDQLLCSNEGIYLNASVEGVTYTWGSDIGFSSANREIRPEETGQYWVTVVDVFNCVESDTIVITPTTEMIMANFLIPSVVGVGNEVHFAQLSEPDPISFNWTFGDGGFSTEENPTHRYFTEGDYTPTLVVSNGVCTDSLIKTITVRNARFAGEFDQLLPGFIDIVDATLYPNPSRDLVKLDLKLTAETEVYIRIYAIDGYLIDERKVQVEDDIIEFDLSGKQEGMYLVRIIVGEKVSTLKLLKTGGTH